ncbi:MAG: DUF1801 domain-containing protein [Flavobacteriaceae bacterium]
MSVNKTIPNALPVTDFLEKIEHPQKKADAYTLLELMKSITGEKPVMWGPSIIGYGSYHYKYDSGREGDMLLTGFSPRAQNLTLYVGASSERNKSLLKKLGKHTTGKSCLYIKKLSDIDMDILHQIIETSYLHYKEKYKS